MLHLTSNLSFKINKLINVMVKMIIMLSKQKERKKHPKSTNVCQGSCLCGQFLILGCYFLLFICSFSFLCSFYTWTHTCTFMLDMLFVDQDEGRGKKVMRDFEGGDQRTKNQTTTAELFCWLHLKGTWTVHFQRPLSVPPSLSLFMHDIREIKALLELIGEINVLF